MIKQILEACDYLVEVFVNKLINKSKVEKFLKVSTIVLFFKFDYQDKLNFLYCNSLHFLCTNALNIRSMRNSSKKISSSFRNSNNTDLFTKLPEKLRNINSNNIKRPSLLRESMFCYSCCTLKGTLISGPRQMYVMPLKYVIKLMENQKLVSEKSEKNYDIFLDENEYIRTDSKVNRKVKNFYC